MIDRPAQTARKRMPRALLIFLFTAFSGPLVSALIISIIRLFFREPRSTAEVMWILAWTLMDTYMFGFPVSALAGIICSVHWFWKRGLDLGLALFYALFSAVILPVVCTIWMGDSALALIMILAPASLLSALVSYGLGKWIGLWGSAPSSL